MSAALRLGAVAYDPKVVTIWDGFERHFAAHGLAVDTVLYGRYESLVEAHLAGHVDVAWNSPLAWLETARVAPAATALVMRDTDCDLTSVVVARAGGKVGSLADLRGGKVGVGAADSPQATLIPLLHLAEAGLEPGRDVEVVRFDVLVGKHGDHIGGERDAARALMRGEVDAACMIDGNHALFAREGVWPAGAVQVIAQTGAYDHCNMTVLPHAPAAEVARFGELLLAMSFDDPAVRPLLELEGLKQWRPGRTSGYALLERAVDRFGTLAAWMARMTNAAKAAPR
ncbi:MAG TPA: PhnD/SsuA/transferrin family substrate-binding protein [Kofleriaceae bacterium]|nr:PhnD/SsuA/transferrin family substrate-binding protein [Kofleriaceae bacterium]